MLRVRGEVTPEDIRAMAAYIAEHRGQETQFQIVWEGRTPGDDPERAAGLTWWIEAMGTAPNGSEDVRTRIRQGPPRLE